MPQPLCVLVHGFTGNPWEVDPLTKVLSRSGYDVMTPLLPGHYHNSRRMEKVKAFDWIHTVEELIERAVSEQRNVHLIGFSMGAMIGVLLAHRLPVHSLVLLSPAVYVVTPKTILTKSRRTFRRWQEDRILFKNVMLHDFVSFHSTPFYNVLQFRKVVREAKKVIPYIHIPVCIIHGLEDEIADPKSSKWIYKTISSQKKELHMLPHSGHLICRDTEADSLIQMVISFLERQK